MTGDQPGLFEAAQTHLTPIVPSGLPDDWKQALAPQFSTPYFHDLTAFLKLERRSQTIYPPGPDVFNALRRTPLESVKVLILGQDPYHGNGQADGLAFSVRRGVRPPPSLQNIFQELHADLPTLTPPEHGNLSAWAEQGVLLLNTVLTVRAGQPKSHAGRGWEPFTDAVIRAVNARPTRVVFVLWGSEARRKSRLITEPQHLDIEAAHPSPLSVAGFTGSRPFSKVNAALSEASTEPIDW